MSEIEFPAYDADEILDIIKERAEFALHPNTIEDSILKLIALASAGDARVAIEILRKASKKADAKLMDDIRYQEVDEAISEINRLGHMQPVQTLNEHQKAILQVLGRHGRLGSGQLYKEYSDSVCKPVVDRAYRNYMNRMVSLGLVKSEGKGRWKRYEVVA